jgi:hypothetical protein
MDDLNRLHSLLEMYEVALDELRASGDPAVEELTTRLECRLATAAYAYYELLHPLGSAEAVDVLPRRAPAHAGALDTLNRT